MPLQIERALLILCATVALAGCAQWPAAEPASSTPVPTPAVIPAPTPAPLPEAPVLSTPTPTPTLPPASEAAQARLLAWQDRLRELPGAELAREVARRDPPADAAASVELALALAYTRTLAQAAGTPANGELARALALLEPVARTASPWQTPARLLQSRLTEQRRLEEQIDKLQQQLRDQQRRNEQLAAQIEALRAIERSLGSTRPPSPPASR